MNKHIWLVSGLLLLVLLLLGAWSGRTTATLSDSVVGAAPGPAVQQAGAVVRAPMQGTPTPTPGCCMVTGTIQPTCAYDPGTQLYDINFTGTITNPCGTTLNVSANFYLEVSTDGVNYGFIRRTSIQNYSFPPGPSPIADGFTGVPIDPQNHYYRIRMQIYACGIYEIYSPGLPLCGAGQPSPTSTPPAVTFTPTGTPTPGGPSPTATTSCCPTPTASGTGICAAPDYYYTFDVTNPCFRPQGGAIQFFFDVAPAASGPWTTYDQTGLQSVLLPANSTISYSGVFTETTIPNQYQWYRTRLVLLTENCSGPIYTSAQTDPAPICGAPTTTPTGTPSPTRTVTPTSTICALTFADVPQSSPFYPYVRCLACRGILSGYTTSPPCAAGQTPCFNGGADVTRGQVAKIVVNGAGFADVIPSTQQTFADVPNTNPFWIYVERAGLHNVISGYSTSPPCPGMTPCFLPFNPVTRGQMAKIDAQAEGYSDPIPSTQQTFADVPNTNPFWIYVERAALHGVISGYSTSPPCPGPTPCFLWANNLTRNQVAKVVAATFFPNCQTPQR